MMTIPARARSNRRNDLPDGKKSFVAVLSRLVSVVLVFVWLAGAESFSKVNSDWSLVQDIPIGSRVLVVLQDNASTGPKTRRIKGDLSVSRSMSITLQLSPVQSKTIGRESVVKVFVRRPLERRIPGWIALAVSGITAQVFVGIVGDSGVLGAVMAHALITGPISVSFFRVFRWRNVYKVPRNERVKSNGT